MYIKITEAWQEALTRALKIEVAAGGVGKPLKYSKKRCKYDGIRTCNKEILS